jgi:hypothetical protein
MGDYITAEISVKTATFDSESLPQNGEDVENVFIDDDPENIDFDMKTVKGKKQIMYAMELYDGSAAYKYIQDGEKLYSIYIKSDYSSDCEEIRTMAYSMELK